MSRMLYEFWKENLDHVLDGEAGAMVENPALIFTRKVKAGDYDTLSDEEYRKLLKECETLAGFWKALPRRAAGDILIEALGASEVRKDLRARLVNTLLRGSFRDEEKTGQESEHESQETDDDRKDREPGGEIRYEWSPKRIFQYLDQSICGQEEAKKAAAMALYNHVEGRRSNTVFCGPTGSGKSEIWRRLAKDFPKLIRIVDASRFSADGWKGSFHLRDVFEGIPLEDLEKYGLIVVFDEADKIICETVVSSGGTNYSAIVQNSFLKMLDGDPLEFGPEDNRKPFRVDCSKVSVVFLGAFEHLLKQKSESSAGMGFGSPVRKECDYGNTEITADDLINAGMRREIAGRINRIAALHPLSVRDYEVILTGPVLDDLQQNGKCRIDISRSSVKLLAKEAVSSGLGVRYMRSRLMNALDDLIYEEPEAKEYYIDLAG